MNEFYVYAWFFVSTNEVFYIGKGKNNRCFEIHKSRNAYFKNIVDKYKDDVKVKILFDNLSEDEAFNLEKRLIKEYWDKGQCKANFHEGGRGGNTGNYDNPERSRKLSEAASKRTGERCGMYGKHHTEETKEKLRKANIGKHLSEEHKQKLIKANTGRPKTEKELLRISNLNKGKKMPKETYDKMINALSKYEYIIRFNGEIIKVCIGHTALYRFCKEKFNISRGIVNKIIDNNWTPKFNKHKWLSELKIEKVCRGVSTNDDECSHVG